MDRELVVHVDIGGDTVRCGRLFARTTPRASSSFEYDAAWLKRTDAFALEPELPLTRGAFHSRGPLFRVFTDPAPDRWGQTLLRRVERRSAKRERRAVRTLGAIDFLVLVDDLTRLGALRFTDAGAGDGAPFLTMGARVPPLLALPKLLGATQRIVADEETDDDLALVLAPGTSLGGARPKASVLAPDGALLIAKFPRKDDDVPVTRWEAVCLALAETAGIRIPGHRLEMIAKQPVLLLERFDRAPTRIPMMSAMTALSADDGEARSYVDVAGAIRSAGAQPKRDLEEMFRRLIFNVLVSNTDDHLRNHAFVREPKGWRLSPAYDLNPVPTDVRPRVHALALDETGDQDASLASALRAAGAFGLSLAEARAITRVVASAVARWRSVAKKHGLSARQVERMESAFEHDDLTAAKKS